VREARRRAGLTQRQLASRAGTTQAVIARAETGASAPSFQRVVELVRACGFDLDIRLVTLDEDTWTLAEQNRQASVEERLERLLAGLEFAEAGRRARADAVGG
jgi:transcriptional regulator with XRE-family HTH domain